MADTSYSYKVSTDAAENRLTAQEGVTVMMPVEITGTCTSGGFDISEAVNKLTEVYAVIMEVYQSGTDEHVGVYDPDNKTLKLIAVADGAEKTSGDVTVKVIIFGKLA